MAAKHTLTIRPNHRGNGRYTYSYFCSCGAKGYGYRTSGEATHYGNKHAPTTTSR